MKDAFSDVLFSQYSVMVAVAQVRAIVAIQVLRELDEGITDLLRSTD